VGGELSQLKDADKPGGAKHVLYFDRRFVSALELELDLRSIPGETARAFDTAQQKVGATEFLPTPEGLAILICESGHLLWIPKENVQNALGDAAKIYAQPERFDLAALRRFDSAHKGWLTDDERHATRRDAVCQQEIQAALESSARTSLAQNGPQWETIFADADANHDGKAVPPSGT